MRRDEVASNAKLDPLEKWAKREIRQVSLEWYTKWDKDFSTEVWDRVIVPVLKARADALVQEAEDQLDRSRLRQGTPAS